MQIRSFDLPTEQVNAAQVYRPKDLASVRNRNIFFVESNFPTLFYWLKKQAILYFLRRKIA